MNRFRYSLDGNWYKGNTHIHSVLSDGGLDYHQLDGLYSDAGYDFLVFTDHWKVSTAETLADLRLLAINGVEIDGKDETGSYFHVVGFGFDELDLNGSTFTEALEKLKAKNALRILAHPHWIGNSLEDAFRHDFHGIEIYNHVCHWLNGKADGVFHWDCMLKKNPQVLGFSVDDAHIRPEYPLWNGGWIMVNAASLTKASILSAIRKGNYYSSQGPEIKHIEAAATQIRVETSLAKIIRLAGENWYGQRIGADDETGITSADFDISDAKGYLRIELEDFNHRKAWTNALFI
ncbi:PHP domain-containing protein [candidate division KSB1 bacterium]|nr:PHP domain-containing protein [candidate division KSB1 bacterium]